MIRLGYCEAMSIVVTVIDVGQKYDLEDEIKMVVALCITMFLHTYYLLSKIVTIIY